MKATALMEHAQRVEFDFRIAYGWVGKDLNVLLRPIFATRFSKPVIQNNAKLSDGALG